MYDVNKKARKNLIAEMAWKRREKMEIFMIFYIFFSFISWSVFLGPTFVLLSEIVDASKKGAKTQIYIYLTIIGISFLAFLVLSIIPKTIKKLAYELYLSRWSGRENETITFYHSFLKWKYVDVYEDKNKNQKEKYLLYSKVSKLVYSPKEKCLKVYSLDNEREVVTIANYFNYFKELVIELEELTGKRVQKIQ